MSRDERSYEYPSQYKDFKEEQKQAHFKGVKEGQLLFEKYMPAEAVDVLKKSDFWDVPYSYDHPSELQLMEDVLPKNYNMLHKTYANVKDSLGDLADDMEGDLEEIGDKDSERAEEQEMDGVVQDEKAEETDSGQLEEERGKKRKNGKYRNLLMEE